MPVIARSSLIETNKAIRFRSESGFSVLKTRGLGGRGTDQSGGDGGVVNSAVIELVENEGIAPPGTPHSHVLRSAQNVGHLRHYPISG